MVDLTVYIINPKTNKADAVHVGSPASNAAAKRYNTKEEAVAAIDRSKDRYDTLVIKNTQQEKIPMTSNGDEVVSWARGHSIAEASALEEFVQRAIDGDFAGEHDDYIMLEAEKAMATARRQRDHSYDE